uniref:Uncharacterized protein n=1 Tax=Leersia perrieri TaxID=77586 RepID=A0A0D9VCA7_9ORYZ
MWHIQKARVGMKCLSYLILFLLTWTNCFTEAFSKGKSWNEMFELCDFRVILGHVQPSKQPGYYGDAGMTNDMTKFVQKIRNIFWVEDNSLISKFPPYFTNFTNLLGRLKITNGVLLPWYKLLLDTHMCMMPSYQRRFFLIFIYREFKNGRNEDKWNAALQNAGLPSNWLTKLKKVIVFKDVIQKAIKDGRSYAPTSDDAFRLARDVAEHGAEHRFAQGGAERYRDDSGIELMIPCYMEDFIPEIVAEVLKEGVNITNEYGLKSYYLILANACGMLEYHVAVADAVYLSGQDQQVLLNLLHETF